MSRAVVTLSGGLDSATCLAIACRDADEVLTVTFDYGQRHRRELEAAKALAEEHYRCSHLVVRFDARTWGGSALTAEIEVPTEGPERGIPVTYVPGRNIIFLAFALSIAEAKDAGAVFLGVNALDYSGYPDCRPEFLEAMGLVARVGQKRGVEGRPIEICAPLLHLSKAEIVRLAAELKVPLEQTWSCYLGGDRPCGACDSCRLRAKGFAEAGMPDPAIESLQTLEPVTGDYEGSVRQAGPDHNEGAP